MTAAPLSAAASRPPPGALWARDFRLPISPWWLGWMVLLALAFLIPNRTVPWLMFDHELVAVVAAAGLAAALVGRARTLDVPPVAVVFAVWAFYPFAQHAAGVIFYFGDAWMAALFLAGIALALLLGFNLLRTFGPVALDALFGALTVAALASVGLALYQWQHLVWADWMVIDLAPGERPYANLGQPNHLSTLIGWGLVGLGWFWLSGRIGAAVGLFAAAFLTFGLAMTQSRTAWLYLPLLTLGALAYRGPLGGRGSAMAAAWVTAMLAVFTWFWPLINRVLSFDLANSLQQRLEGGLRPRHWKEVIDSLQIHPWAGWGWNQIGVAQQAVARRSAPMPEIIDQSHNVILDILCWNGLVVGVPLVLAGLWGLAAVARRVRSREGVLCLLAFMVFTVHALVEYPHAYAYFLFPAALMIGVAAAEAGGRGIVRLPRVAAGGVAALFAAAFVWTSVEYFRASHNLEVLRFESARIGTGRNSKTPPLPLLTQLHAFLEVNRYKLDDPVIPQRLETMRRVSLRFPTQVFQLRYAMAAARSGDRAAAEDSLARLCLLQSRDDCDGSLAAWSEFAANRYPFLRGVPLPSEAQRNKK